MKRAHWIVALAAASAGLVVLQACSGDNNNETDGGTDASNDVTQQNDAAKQDVVTNDVINDVINDVMDASDGACPSSWTLVPVLPDAGQNLVPDGGLPPMLIHAAATGTQNYTCTATTGDAGTTYAWLFVGPQANLDDCNQQLIAHHFASEAGAAAPEWQTVDQSYVIASKKQVYTPDASAVPWLLLQETSNGGSGTISKTLWIQRLYTSGGVAPTTTCDQNNVNTNQNVAYTADYYFYGQ
jgi:hypothetical protein